MPRSNQRGAGPAPARWHGRQGAGASSALDGMQGRGAAADIALAELAFRRRRSPYPGTKRRNTWTISSRLPPKRPTISPRASTSSPASAAVAGAPERRSCRDDRAGKAPGAPCRSASPMVIHARRPGAATAGQPAGALAVMAEIGSPAKRVGADSSVASENRVIRHLHVHQHRVDAPPAPAERPPARRRRKPTRAPSLLNSSATWRFSALSSTTSRRTWLSLGALHRARRRGWPKPVRRCNRGSYQSASCLRA